MAFEGLFDKQLLIALLVIHVIFCGVYLIAFGRNKMRLCLFPIVLVVPYLGIFIILIVHIGAKLGKQEIEYAQDEVFLVDEKMEYVSQLNGHKEMNIVPVEEALIMNEKSVQRSVVMEIAKRDPEKYLSNLKRALMSDDTETAHYAASSITELKRGYDKKLLNAKEQYEKDTTATIHRREYINMLNTIIKADLIIDNIKQTHIESLIDILITDINTSENPPHDSFEMLGQYLVERGDYEQAKKWAQRYQEYYSRSDRPLRLKLNIAYKTKDKKMFYDIKQAIEEAQFPITQKTLKIIEFWSRGKSSE